MPKVLPNGMPPLNILLKNDDESRCHLLKRIELQTYIGGGQLTFLQILMLCDILASQKQCSIKCLRSLQPVQKDFLNMVQAMPSPSKIHIEMWRNFFFFFWICAKFCTNNYGWWWIFKAPMLANWTQLSLFNLESRCWKLQ